jgi:hypothetical protein
MRHHSRIKKGNLHDIRKEQETKRMQTIHRFSGVEKDGLRGCTSFTIEIGQALGLIFQQPNFCNFRDIEFNEEVGCGDLDKKKKIEWHRYGD